MRMGRLYFFRSCAYALIPLFVRVMRGVGPVDLAQGRTGDWEVVIGLEVHAQVAPKSSFFWGVNEFGLNRTNRWRS